MRIILDARNVLIGRDLVHRQRGRVGQDLARRREALPKRSVRQMAGAKVWKVMNDFELVRCYGEDRSEAAFAELVKRYIDFVYSAALRQVGGDAHLAEDVVQSVFVDLARKAGSLPEQTVLSGWLYTGTRYAAAKAVRGEQRRRAREQESFRMQECAHDPGAESSSSWHTVKPVLDSAMHDLSERDRNAVLLRYFENRPLAEVGARLGLSEDAARMRVRRALEKLRDLLGRRGVSSTSAALAGLLAQQTVGAAPAGLAATIVGSALTGAAASSAPALTLLNLMNAKLKVGLATAAVVAGVATPLAIQERAQRRDLRAENAALRQQVEALGSLASENERLSNLLARTTVAAAVAQTNPSSELLKLRSEVGRLREENRELARLKAPPAEAGKSGSFDAALQTVAARATQLQEGLKQMPHQNIPELQFLNQQDWVRTAGNVNRLETEKDYRKAFSDLRVRAKTAFGTQLQHALGQFAQNNNGMLPAELSQLQPYFEQPVDPAVLERYQMLQSGKLSDVTGRPPMLVGEKAPVDDEYDTQIQFGLPDVKVVRPNNRGG